MYGYGSGGHGGSGGMPMSAGANGAALPAGYGGDDGAMPMAFMTGGPAGPTSSSAAAVARSRSHTLPSSIATHANGFAPMDGRSVAMPHAAYSPEDDLDDVDSLLGDLSYSDSYGDLTHETSGMAAVRGAGGYPSSGMPPSPSTSMLDADGAVGPGAPYDMSPGGATSGAYAGGGAYSTGGEDRGGSPSGLQRRPPSVSGRALLRCEFEGCNRTFKRSEHMKRHIRSHTGERPFRCEYPGCDRLFSRADNLQQHWRVHTQGGKARTPGPSSLPGANGLDGMPSIPGTELDRRASAGSLISTGDGPPDMLPT